MPSHASDPDPGMPSPSKKQLTRVCISYARSDEALARRLADGLRTREFDVFFDVDAVGPGANYPLEVGKALARSDAIVVLLSKDSLESPLARGVWEFALMSKKHEWRVLPVLTPGTRMTEVPWISEHLHPVKAGRDWNRGTDRVAPALRQIAGAE